MFVLCALIGPDQIRRLELHDPSSFASNIRDDNVTGRLNIVNRPPDRCAAHPLIVQMHNTKILGACFDCGTPQMNVEFRT